VVHKVRSSLAELLDSIGADPTRPQQIARQFGLNKNLTWKISKTLCESDPFSAIQHIPGKPGLNILIRTLLKAGAPAAAIDGARASFAEFDNLVATHAGDRETLHIMLSNLTDDGEQQRGEAHRRLAFRGNSAIWGVQTKIQLTANFIAPGEKPDMADLAWLSGLIGFRRLRNDVPWTIASARKAVDNGTVLPVGTIEPIDPDHAGDDVAPLVGKFCSKNLPEIRSITTPEGMLRYELSEGPVGNTAAVSCVVGLFGRSFVQRFRSFDDTIGEHYARLYTPAEMLIHDLFVHEDLDYAMDPAITLYSHLPGGPIFPAGGRECGILPLQERVHELGRGPNAVLTPEIPRYREMLQNVFDRLDWDVNRFHGYRFKMLYPPVPSLAVLHYPLPDKT